jgi:hypothetical protein
VTEFGFRLPIVLEFQAVDDRALHASAGAKLTIKNRADRAAAAIRPGLLTVGAIGFRLRRDRNAQGADARSAATN